MTGMDAASMFCVHKRLRTNCPECKPPPPPPKPKPERAARAARRDETDGIATIPKRAKPPPDPKARPHKRVKPPTREEAEHAQAWWVKKK